jgi:hypothetical protein
MAKKALRNKARSDTQVQGARLHAMPSLWAIARGVPQVHAVPHLPTRVGTRR